MVVYICYLAAASFAPIAIVGLIIAYVQRGQAPNYLASHYTFAIRTFWIGLLYNAAVVALMLLMILPLHDTLSVLAVIWLVLGALGVLAWWVVRCIFGLVALNRGAPLANPESWLFGS